MFDEEFGPFTDYCICLITRQIKRQERSVTQYLMVRNNRGMNAGLFNFPGGHLEKNETFEDGNVREVWEETGIKVEKSELCGRFDISFGEPKEKGWPWEQPPRMHVFIFKSDSFSGKLRNPLLQPGQTLPEVKAFWCDEDKIPFNQMRDNDKQWFKLYKESGYVNNPLFIRKNNKLAGALCTENIKESKIENEDRETENFLKIRCRGRFDHLY